MLLKIKRGMCALALRFFVSFVVHTRRTETTRASGQELLFTGDACMPVFDSRTMSVKHCPVAAASLIFSETGRTLSDAERGAREASGLPGQRTGRDI